MIDINSNLPVGELLLHPKLNKFQETKTFKDTEADLNDEVSVEFP